jgi:DUF1365 family protein
MTESALYSGRVVHTRFRPVRHRLRYRMLSMLVDLDELPGLAKTLRFFSFGGFNLFSFHNRDHCGGTDAPLRPQIEAMLARAGVQPDGGAIRLWCMPRVLGLVFNPLSVFFCHRSDGALVALVYEVNNTFGQRHSYVIPAEMGDGAVVRQECAKTFHVSPFMDLAMTYRFRVVPPGTRIAVAVEGHDREAAIISAAFVGTRSALSDDALLRAFLRHPVLALQVLGAIHWEALKLWRKGLAIRPLPPLPADPVSIGTSRGQG